MKTATKTLTTGIISLIVAGTSFTALSGQSDHDRNDHNPELVNQASLTAEQAIAIALSDIPGKVVEAEIEKEDGMLVWEIEVLNNENQVYEFEIDAKDGRILEKELDND